MPDAVRIAAARSLSPTKQAPQQGIMSQTIELGLDTFGDITDGPGGKPLHAAQVIRNLVEEAVLADEVGVDYIGLGEHHRSDFAVSSPEMVLAAIASRTSRIRLGSAVTVLSSDDPIRVFQRFSTLDALSNGRAEVILGRGSFVESFPLFGFDLKQYEELFNEKLDLFAAVLSERPVTWHGTIRSPLQNQSVHPKTESGRLATWIGVGGTPQSVLRAARYGLPLMLVSVFIISLLIGWTMRQTGRLLPCIVAHGVFDAIQLLIIIPLAMRMIE